MRIGLYPGSFDPVTLGHLDVIIRSSRLVDKLVIGVLNNSEKSPLFTSEERVNMLKDVTGFVDNIEIEAFDGLLVDYADLKNADIIVRGLRAVTDFEYELQLAQTNHKINPRIDTVFLTTSVEYSYLSSSIVRDIAKYDGDIRELVPSEIADLIYEKYRNNKQNI